MTLFGLLITLYFFIVIFITGQPDEKITNPFLAYYDIQIGFIFNHLWIILLLFAGVTLLFRRINKRKVNLSFSRFIKKIIVGLSVGSLTTFFFLFFIALIEVNVLSILTYLNSGLLGVDSNTQHISDKLKKGNSPPIVIAGSKEGNILPLTIAIAQSGKKSFYGSKVIPIIPSFLTIKPKKLNSGVLMVGDSLIITELNSSDFQNLSPEVVYLMITNYFPSKNIKYYPKVILMNKNEYLSFRKDDFENILKKYNEVIAKIYEDSKSLSISIEDLKLRIAENQLRLKQTTTQKEKEYIKCINEGYYLSGIFYRKNTKTYCEEESTDLEDLIKQIKIDGEELKAQLEKNQQKLEQYRTYEKFYSSQKIITQDESSYISFEFGTFSSPDTIKVSLATQNDTRAAADLFELITHEYLHYSTYEENSEKIGSSFFEEGLTEYFARKIIKNSLGIDTNLAYSVNVKIIDQMTKRINENDFADIYFAKDQARLEKLLDKVYGKDFYKNNTVLFETLQYASDKEQILKIGSDIMAEIGGSSLSENDLMTSYTTFQ